MIEFHAVAKEYPDGTMAVKEFSFRVPEHRTVVLVGSSGSGKTTLLRMVNRMVDPTRGQVTIDGQDIRDRDPIELRRSIGYVLQAGGLMPHRSVAENVATVPMLNGVKRKQALDLVSPLLERVGLDPGLAQRFPGQLSGGQQQRVGVARALAADPDILLMDEPFAAVDPIVRRELQEELLELQSQLNKTVLFVTHDIDEAFRLGDEIVVLRSGGEIAQHGTAADILSNPADDFVADFVGIDKAERRLTVSTVDGRRLAVDGNGRPVGIVSE